MTSPSTSTRTEPSGPRRELLLLLAGAALVLVGAYVPYLLPGLLPAPDAPAPPGPAALEARSPARLEEMQKAYDVAQKLKSGGYILYFRHGQREKWDAVIAFDVYETATGTDSLGASYAKAVCLTPQGIEEGRMIGRIFELAKVPVGTVIASPSCRASQTAMLAFGRIDGTDRGLVHTPVVNAVNQDEFKEALRQRLRTIEIPSGKNAVIAAHENTLRNHPDLFVAGSEYLQGPIVLETGFYVIQRDVDGSLRIVYKFMSLGDFAASAVTLHPTGKRFD